MLSRLIGGEATCDEDCGFTTFLFLCGGGGLLKAEATWGHGFHIQLVNALQLWQDSGDTQTSIIQQIYKGTDKAADQYDNWSIIKRFLGSSS